MRTQLHIIYLVNSKDLQYRLFIMFKISSFCHKYYECCKKVRFSKLRGLTEGPVPSLITHVKNFNHLREMEHC